MSVIFTEILKFPESLTIKTRPGKVFFFLLKSPTNTFKLYYSILKKCMKSDNLNFYV